MANDAFHQMTNAAEVQSAADLRALADAAQISANATQIMAEAAKTSARSAVIQSWVAIGVSAVAAAAAVVALFVKLDQACVAQS